MRKQIKDFFIPVGTSQPSFIFKELYEAFKSNPNYKPFPFLKETNYRILDYDYCLIHSSDKYVINVLNKLFDSKDFDIDYKYVLNILAITIHERFYDKWNNIYKVLKQEYDTFKDYNIVKNNSYEMNARGSKTNTNESTSKTGTNIKETNTDNNNDSIYGFGSSDSTPTENNNSTGTTTTMGNLEDNIEMSNYTNNGVNEQNKTYSENSTTSGLTNHTNQELLENELRVRKQYFLDVVYKDLDSLLCLDVY